MDKNRALVEIERILWAKDSQEKTTETIRFELKQVLEELQTYSYNLGKRHGMFKAVNILTEEAEKEGK